jgi:2-dehydro-3-deoxygluconokinase
MVELSEYPDGTLTRSFGGDTLNTALYLARLGVPTDYVTALGDDPFSDGMMAAWAAEGIGTGLVARVPGRLPGLYLIRTEPGGERHFFHWRDSAPVRQLFELPQTEAIEAALCRAPLVYYSGITLSLFDGRSRARLFAALARARSEGARIVFDTNFRARGWPDREAARQAFSEAVRSSDVVLASTEDWAPLFGARDADGTVARLRDAGVSEMVVKLDRPCCRVIADGVDELLAAEPVADVLDTTAAGDSFAAAYLAARLAGRDPPASVRAGHALAGIVVRHRGAIIPASAMPGVQPNEAP